MLLAAGFGTRAGARDKLLEPFGGRPLVQHALDNLRAAVPDALAIVTGHRATTLLDALNEHSLRDVRQAHNPHPETGLSGSLQHAVTALDDCDAIVVALADMPHVDPGVVRALMSAFRQQPGATMIVPRYRGRDGNPVLLARALYPAIASLTGDTGARALRAHAVTRLRHIDTDCAGILVDYDTGEALDSLGR